MLNEKFTFWFEVTIKWNLTKTHAARLKSAKYKTRVIQQHFFKWMSYCQMDWSYGLSSYDGTLFLSYQKLWKVQIACSSYSKEGDLYWLDD